MQSGKQAQGVELVEMVLHTWQCSVRAATLAAITYDATADTDLESNSLNILSWILDTACLSIMSNNRKTTVRHQ